MSDVTLSKAVRSNLMSLQNTAEMMNKTQSRLATGNKVNSALDNPSNFFTASALNSRAADMSNLLDSMASGIKVIEAANNGLTALTKNLESMQSTLRQARQDKSFQTKSFEVGDNSVINLSGGQFGDLNVKVDLASATQEGTKAAVSTAATSFLGPVSTAGGEQGSGARSVISGMGGFTNNDKISVAGVEVTLSEPSVGAPLTADSVANNIRAALQNDPSTLNKFTVTAGTGANSGKVIIETVDPTAEAAEVEFGAGSVAATKGETSFNYSAITSNVSVGGQTIATGSTFDSFVKNLQDGAAAGGYTVTPDATTKDIKLTSTAWGGAAPTVTGVPTNSGAVAGSAAETTFTLTSYNDAGTQKLTSAQDLNIAGATGAVSLTAGMTGAQIKSAIEGDANINAAYNVTVDNTTLEVTLEAKTNGTTAPGVTSTKAAVAMSPASMTTSGGSVDLSTGTTDLSAYAGTEFTITDGTNTATHTIANGETAADLMTALNANGFTVTGTNGGLSITSASGTNFTLTIDSGSTDFGLAASSEASTNGVVASPAGITGAVNTTNGVADTAAVIGQTSTPPVQGASVEAVEAATNNFTVSYDGKTADISIGAVKGGIGSTSNIVEVKEWQDKTVAAVNTTLAQAGITGVEAKFGDDGKFSIVAKTAEAKTIAISGDDSVALFGTDGVKTGVAEKSQLNSTKTVDKFVELINRDHGTKVRASNDNGKLRIENLSTQSLDVGVDKDGNNAVNTTKVDGNSVRANLSKQFNELRDQLDKLSDDASFNGINLLRGDKLKITFNESGTSSIDIQAKDKDGNIRAINASNLSVESLTAEDLDTDEKIDAFLSNLSTALTELRSQSSAFGSNLSSVENRQSFTKNMINTLETGAANLTLADTNEEAANLLALQTRQQLSSSALSMASQQDQAVLQLLR